MSYIRHRLTFLFFVIFCLSANGQSPTIHYQIDGNYLDETDTFEGVEKMTYTHHGQKLLDRIYIHLWANAYSDKNSDYTKQSVRAGNVDFVYADEDKMGGYQTMIVEIDDYPIELKYENPEVAYIMLPKMLSNGESVEITFDYSLKMPPKYDRFGYEKEDVFFAHFYPKAVVYENGKWQKMPYLLYGEGYSEYADFDINVHFEDYESIASGQVFQRSNHHLMFSSKNVVDVAFALSKTKKIESFTSGNINVEYLADSTTVIPTDIVKSAIHFLEKRIGKFPYDHISIYEESGRGGMEYPGLITVSGTDKTLEHYIVHELAHQYFYAALANNQRSEGWIDEGFATFFEKEYFKEKYGQLYYESMVPKMLKSHRGTLHGMSEHQISRGFSEPLNTEAIDISPVNYMMNHYEIPATYIGQLQAYLGKEDFNKGVKHLYQNHKNNHINAADITQSFQTNGKNIDWLSKAMTSSPKNDYKVKSLKNGVLVTENKGDQELPYPVVLDDKQTIWIEGHSGTEETHVGESKKAVIDPNFITIDQNRRNNYSSRGWRVGLPKLLSNPAHRNLYFMPYAAYNTSDKLMLGLGITNDFLPYQNTKFFIAPSYGFGSKELTGIADIRHNLPIDNQAFRKIQLGIKGKKFTIGDKPYSKISPTIALHFNHGNASQSVSKLTFTSNHIHYDYDFERAPDSLRTSNWSNIQNLTYTFRNDFVLYPTEINIDVEHQAYKTFAQSNERYVKLSAEWKQGFAYRQNKSVDFRFFGGFFLYNTERSSSTYNSPLITRGSYSLWGNARQDYGLNDYFLNRKNGETGFLSRQLSDYNSGGFKTAIPQGYKIGLSNDYIVTLGIKADLPIDLPLGIQLKGFFDYGMYNAKVSNNARFTQKGLYSGGVMIEFGKGMFAFHLPLINSSEISNIYKENGVNTLGKISFKMDLNRFNIFDLIDDYNP